MPCDEKTSINSFLSTGVTGGAPERVAVKCLCWKRDPKYMDRELTIAKIRHENVIEIYGSFK